MKKEIKTNAMRALDKLNIEYEHIDYGFEGEFKSTVDLTEETHQDISVVYKTLATISNTKDIYIFVIPGAENIDFKKASRCVGVKSLEMLPLKDLKSKVGYERGATTSLAMKKNYDVVIDESSKEHDYIKVSAGKVGHSIKIKAEDLAKANDAKFFDVIQK
ncbi:aminoacyl-tRNA deacylase [Anaerococcus octavius]|uniref:Cys-tRNA(Pro)/Cys-tRNA(Cys) deacylase n=1 Tax=Anaerococcus octavius TaxID=54007 RepID=A0A2I1MAH6_9FIRM|nr:aminoacyl-tRNA deacylase [Anaerococcus octavius]PKZ17143.1 aminoacyl-tRNA deacylase [Anaerococcus octavius]SUU92810.1 Cys-tRNA(Pro)/Cys-tRNA(Cys) deacylase ybaK [Anaerococcus octavius]